MDLGQREEDMERELQTVGALWRVICCSVAHHTLVFLEELLMKILDLREYMQAAINVDEVAMGRSAFPPTVRCLNSRRVKAGRMILRSTCNLWCSRCRQWITNGWPKPLLPRCSRSIRLATCHGPVPLKSLR
jgi:hypothetical protein